MVALFLSSRIRLSGRLPQNAAPCLGPAGGGGGLRDATGRRGGLQERRRLPFAVPAGGQECLYGGQVWLRDRAEWRQLPSGAYRCVPC